MTIETLEALFEKAPETFLRALDACHQLAGRGFEPTAIDVRKALGNRGSLEVIQAAVKRYRELSGYVGVETLLPVTLANDLVIAAEAVFQRYQKREAARLDTLTGTYDTSLESLATELQSTLQNNAALQAQMGMLEHERDAAQQEAIKKEEEGTALRARLHLTQDALDEARRRVSELETKLQTGEEARSRLQEVHANELAERLAQQLVAVNQQWDPEVTAWKLRCDAERRAHDATRDKAERESRALREAWQAAGVAQAETSKLAATLETRVEILTAQLQQSRLDAEAREVLLKSMLAQIQDGAQSLLKDHQNQGTRLVALETVIHQISSVLARGGAPAKVVAALKAVMPTSMQVS